MTAIRPSRQAWRTPLRAIAGSAALAALALLHVSAQESDKLDADAVARIRDEGMQRSQVMEIMSYLTDVYGPRLTGSPDPHISHLRARGRRQLSSTGFD